MINSEKAKSQYVTAGVKTFAIGFEYGLDDLGNPEIAVTLAGTPLQFGADYTLSLDGQSIVLVNDVEEGQTLIIERDIDFVQDSDYQLGRIDPEQIEDDFDLSVMRDQQIRQELEDYKTVTDAALEDISEQLVEHQDSIETLTQNVSDLETNKADKSSVYTKGETDDKLALKADKADTYTKTDVDTKLTAKADKATVYTKTDVDGKLATKADKATTLAGYGITDAYTKEETSEELDAKLAKDQGVDNAGKVLGIGEDGNVTPVEVAADSLPDQTGNAGKFLTTDGTNASWGEVQAAAITTDATLAGTGTADSPLGLAQSVQDSIDGKLPLAGGEFTSGATVVLPGTLQLINETSPTQYWNITAEDGVSLRFTSSVLDRGFSVSSLAIIPWNTTSMDLGRSGQSFGIAYIHGINNGAEIAIPTTGGTMALLSDIPDISNLATKTEVQQEIQDAIGTIETALAEV